MKKMIFMAALAVMTAGFTGCDKNEESRPYYWNVELTNETDREISLTYWDKTGPTKNHITIAPGQTGTLTGIDYYGPAESFEKLTDPRPMYRSIPFAYEEKRSVSIYIGSSSPTAFDSASNPSGIWSHQNWTFKGDFYEYTYKLTVTEKFLNDKWPEFFGKPKE